MERRFRPGGRKGGGRELGIANQSIGKGAAAHKQGNRERMTTDTSTIQRVAVEGVPVEMVPTTARGHITGFAALNIPHA